MRKADRRGVSVAYEDRTPLMRLAGISNEWYARRDLRRRFRQAPAEVPVVRRGARFYVSARLGNRAVFLAGPYASHMSALSAVPFARVMDGRPVVCWGLDNPREPLKRLAGHTVTYEILPPDPGFGEVYGHAYPTPEGPVWMFRKGQRVRFFNAAGEQVGPEQSNVAPAVVYAMSEGWCGEALRAYVFANTRPSRKGQRDNGEH